MIYTKSWNNDWKSPSQVCRCTMHLVPNFRGKKYGDWKPVNVDVSSSFLGKFRTCVRRFLTQLLSFFYWWNCCCCFCFSMTEFTFRNWRKSGCFNTMTSPIFFLKQVQGEMEANQITIVFLYLQLSITGFFFSLFQKNCNGKSFSVLTI